MIVASMSGQCFLVNVSAHFLNYARAQLPFLAPNANTFGSDGKVSNIVSLLLIPGTFANSFSCRLAYVA